jgi:hypothetical protein
MNSNQTGQSNTAIGCNSLLNCIGGNVNTAVGINSLQYKATGSLNTAIGSSSGINDISGNYNTFLGVNTGVSSNTIIYNNSTALGYQAIIDASNQIVLGTSTEKINIPGSYVGIGGVYNPSSGYALDVQGNSGTILRLQNNSTPYNSSYSNIEFWVNQSDFPLGSITTQDIAGTNPPGDAYLSQMSFNVNFNSTSIGALVNGMTLTGTYGVDPSTVDTGGANLTINGATYYSGLTSNPMPAALTIATTTGSQQLLIGSYYTSEVGQACAIQSVDYYSSQDYPQPLLLNPQGGNVTVGTILEMYTAGNTPGNITDSYIQNTGAGWLHLVGSNGGGGSGVIVDSTGNVGIQGSPSGDYALDVNGSISLTGNLYMNNATEIWGTNTSGTQEVFLYPRWSDNATYLNYGSNGFNIRNNDGVATTMFMTSSNQVGIGTTNPQYTLDVTSGSIGAKTITATGTITAASFNATSDYRIKENVVPLDETFTVDNLRPVTYNNSKSEKQDIGLIAHELQEIYPFLVNGEKDGEEIQSVNYTGLIGILIKEIQELKKRVKELEQK